MFAGIITSCLFIIIIPVQLEQFHVHQAESSAWKWRKCIPPKRWYNNQITQHNIFYMSVNKLIKRAFHPLIYFTTRLFLIPLKGPIIPSILCNSIILLHSMH
jgi:hypothetical protein